MIASAQLRLRTLVALLSRHKRAFFAGLAAVTVSAPALAIGLADPAWREGPTMAEIFDLRPAAAEPQAKPLKVIGWEGRDLDGDGAADIVNPTGQAPRGEDAYGEGAFKASRDGGSRAHAGVDYVADAGQAVLAPISGFVTRIGFPYSNNESLRYVEITNPALRISARVFYVEAQVVVGQTVRLGTPIGVAQTLQARYPRGITDHVHLEVADAVSGRKLDAATLIHAKMG